MAEFLEHQTFRSFYGASASSALRGDYRWGVLIRRVTGADPIKGIGSRLMVLAPSSTGRGLWSGAGGWGGGVGEKLESGACRGRSWAQRDRNPGTIKDKGLGVSQATEAFTMRRQPRHTGGNRVQ